MKKILLLFFVVGFMFLFANDQGDKFCQVGDPDCDKYAAEIDENKEKFIIYAADACENKKDLSYCHNLGVYLTQNKLYKYARDYYTIACDLDYGPSCYNLAYLEEFDEKIELSRKYFQKACDLGVKESCDELKRIEND